MRYNYSSPLYRPESEALDESKTIPPYVDPYSQEPSASAMPQPPPPRKIVPQQPDWDHTTDGRKPASGGSSSGTGSPGSKLLPNEGIQPIQPGDIPPPPKHQKENNLAIFVSIGIALLLFLVLLVACCCKKRRFSGTGHIFDTETTEIDELGLNIDSERGAGLKLKLKKKSSSSDPQNPYSLST